MKFSTNTIFYPDNNQLVKAIDHYKSLVADGDDIDSSPDNSAAVRDNFIHTRGNYEQHRFSSNILENAREKLESLLTEDYRKQDASGWATASNSLGNILAAQAQQLSDVDLYDKAIESFTHALDVFTQQDHGQEWALTKYNQGTAMQALGRQQCDAKILKQSIDAYTDALLVWSREANPFDWALTMHQLGAVFHEYGKILKGNRNLQKSVVAYKNALAGFDADTTALELAATHNNRGVVLQNLGESEGNAERLQEAIRSYQTALTVCMEQQQPFHLAVICRVNMATAKGQLADLTKDAAMAEEVADDLEVIIELFHESLQPLCFKHCEKEMEKAVLLRAELNKE